MMWRRISKAKGKEDVAVAGALENGAVLR